MIRSEHGKVERYCDRCEIWMVPTFGCHHDDGDWHSLCCPHCAPRQVDNKTPTDPISALAKAFIRRRRRYTDPDDHDLYTGPELW